MIARKLLAGLLLFGLPAISGSDDAWEMIHLEMREALAQLSREYFRSRSWENPQLPPAVTGPATPAAPWMILVGFTGGVEKKDSSASGVVAMKKCLRGHVQGRNDVLALTFNNLRWRRAASEVREVVRSAQTAAGSTPTIRQPLIVVYGHSWGAGSITNFARQLNSEGLEISLAVYIDAFCWRNPRLPGNIRYAVNFYQRGGILKGLPMRGKSKLIPEDPRTTRILGNYKVDPLTERWGWSWNLLQPLFYRRHHLIAHDLRLQSYLLEIVNMKLALLQRTQGAAQAQRRRLFDRVVILGASVSASEKALSPGWLLARRMGTPEKEIFVFAEGGASSDKHVAFLDNISRLRPTLIVALDLFYHDFKLSLFLSESKKNYLRDYIRRLHATGAVVVLGNIPPQVLLRYEHVNRYLEALAEDFPALVLMDVRDLVDQLDEEGITVRYESEQLVLRKDDVFADRVHPNELGSAIMANLILERLKAEFPEDFADGGAGNPRSVPLPLHK